MDDFRCPQCESQIGSSKGEIGIYCWKCGVQFGHTASTKPIRRDKSTAGNRPGLAVFCATVGPGVIYWIVIRYHHLLPVSIRALGGLWLIPAAGLALFGLASTAYAVDRLAMVERSYSWPFKLAIYILLLNVNAFLLIGAIKIGRASGRERV